MRFVFLLSTVNNFGYEPGLNQTVRVARGVPVMNVRLINHDIINYTGVRSQHSTNDILIFDFMLDLEVECQMLRPDPLWPYK